MKKTKIKKGNIYFEKEDQRYFSIIKLRDRTENYWIVNVHTTKPKFYSDIGEQDWYSGDYINSNDTKLVGKLISKYKPRMKKIKFILNSSRLDSIE